MESIDTHTEVYKAPLFLHPTRNSINCSRGELMLNEYELESLHQLLGDNWRFERSNTHTSHTQLDNTHTHTPSNIYSRTRKTQKIQNNETKHEDQSSVSTDQQSSIEIPIYTSTNTHTHTIVQPSTNSPQTSHEEDNWLIILHTIIEEIIQDIPSPFNKYIKSKDKHISQHTHPIQPIGLENILDNITHNKYKTPLQIIDDTYIVFQCAFSYFEISSENWMHVQEISRKFEFLLSKYTFINKLLDPILRTTHLTNKEWDKHYKFSSQPPPQSQSNTMTKKHKIDKGQQQDNTQRKKRSYTPRKPTHIQTTTTTTPIHHHNNTTTTTTPIYHPSTHLSTSSYTNTRPTLSQFEKQKLIKNNSQITEEEQRDFQQLLSELNYEQHFNLYNEYQTKAIWRRFDSGEVELDDRSTPPHIFRDMVMWCRLQLFTTHTHKGNQHHQHNNNNSGVCNISKNIHGNIGGNNTISHTHGNNTHFNHYDSSDDSSDTDSSLEDSESDSVIGIPQGNSDYKLRY